MNIPMHMPMYMGLENEMEVYREGKRIDFAEVFGEVIGVFDEPFFRKTLTAIRTTSGTSVYVDKPGAEVCTPPIMIRQGFAQELADSLYLARQRLMRFVEHAKSDVDLVGYSTHWNHSFVMKRPLASELMQVVAPAYSLFGLTPLSSGINIRSKPFVHELLTDHVEDLDQVRALAVLYAGTIAHFEACVESIPFRCEIDNKRHHKNLIPDGRHTLLDVRDRQGKRRTLVAQNYLEALYEFFEPAIRSVATPGDIENLEAFISGEKQLEIDKTLKYTGIAFPQGELDAEQRLRLCIDKGGYDNARESPTAHTKFLGEIVSGEGSLSYRPKEMDWDKIVFPRSRFFVIETIDLVSRIFEDTKEDERERILASLYATGLTERNLVKALYEIREGIDPERVAQFSSVDASLQEMLLAVYQRMQEQIPERSIEGNAIDLDLFA